MYSKIPESWEDSLQEIHTMPRRVQICNARTEGKKPTNYFAVWTAGREKLVQAIYRLKPKNETTGTGTCSASTSASY